MKTLSLILILLTSVCFADDEINFHIKDIDETIQAATVISLTDAEALIYGQLLKISESIGGLNDDRTLSFDETSYGVEDVEPEKIDSFDISCPTCNMMGNWWIDVLVIKDEAMGQDYLMFKFGDSIQVIPRRVK